jgi:hypothetical protein
VSRLENAEEHPGMLAERLPNNAGHN